LIANTFKDNIWSGVLNQDALDEGAIPIYTEIPSLRPFIADIWKWSQFARKKNLLTLTGTICGDAGLEVIDEIDRVYLKIVEPELVKEVILDSFGNCKGYTIEFDRNHPDRETQTVTYTKVVSKEGDTIKFETFLNEKPYAWPENVDYAGSPVSSWVENYGFVPFTWLRHVDNGTWYGESEYLAGLSRFIEIDDVASKLTDIIRKNVEPIWAIKGAKPKSSETAPKTGKTILRPRPEGEELNLYYLGADMDIEPLVANLNIEHSLLHIEKLVEFLEKVYPETMIARMQYQDTPMSGRALRIARQPVETRIRERRIGYDTGLTTALKMSISIGGYRGIYPGITLNSYAQGQLDFTISEREVYPIDPADASEIEKRFWEAAKVAVEVGVPLSGYLLNKGWTTEEVELMLNPTTGAIIQTEVSEDE